MQTNGFLQLFLFPKDQRKNMRIPFYSTLYIDLSVILT